MNILEALEKSDKIKLWDEKNGTFFTLDKGFEFISIPVRLLLSDQWQPIIEPLTFEKIKAECVAGESLLVDAIGDTRLYLGFNRKGRLVLDFRSGANAGTWAESEIKNWKISDEKWGGE